jgi:Cation/multidrug efflux pump
MTTFFHGVFRRKAAVIVLVVAALGLGVFSFSTMPMEFLPEMENPEVTVSVIGPGYDAASMEKHVTNPLENSLAAVKGKTNLFSVSGDGFSQINLFFDSRTDMDEATAEVEKAVGSVSLPERVSKPYVVQFDSSMIPVAFVTLTFAEGTSEAQREKIEQRALNEFRGIDGVGHVQLAGKSRLEARIVPDPAKLEEKGVPVQALYGVLRGREVSASIGEARLGGETVNLNVSAGIRDLEDLKRLPVAAGVALGDVASVTLENRGESINRINGRDALTYVISKSAAANAVQVGSGVKRVIETINAQFPEADMRMMYNTSEEVANSVNSMMREVLMGALFATAVILLFIRNIRATLVTVVSIPLSLAITLVLLDFSGVTLNIATLGGVAVAIGRLVDDSIVVIENIFRRLQKEKFSAGVVIDATREVSRAITASTLATVAVFLPAGLLRGSLQAILLPFALTVTYSLLASLVVALTVIPLMSSGLLKTAKINEHRPPGRFVKFLDWNLRHKWVPIFLSVALFAGSVGAFIVMPKGALGSPVSQNLTISLEYAPDTPVDQVFENGKRLEAFLMAQEGTDWVNMSMGNSAEGARYGSVQSPTRVNYTVQLKEGTDADQVVDAVLAEQPNYPGAVLNAGSGNFMFGSSSTQIFVDIAGERPDDLSATAAQVMEKIRPIPHVINVQSNQEEQKTVYTLDVDETKARAEDIAAQLQGMLNAVPVGSVSLEDQTVPVILEPIFKPSSEAELNAVTAMTDEGPKPVSSFASWVKTRKPATYLHKDGQSYIRVTATVDPSRLSVVGAEIRERLEEITPPAGVSLLFGGASVEQTADFIDLFMMMIVGIVILYLIMVFTFRTLRAPLAILSPVPLVSIGSVPGLMVAGISPDFTAIFGVVMLVGIVVTNAIVLIDRVVHNEESMTIREALLEAAGTRMRPILMTATATVGAMVPLVFGSTETGSIVSQNLAIVVIGGLTVATLLTLVFVPCVYELLFFRKARRQRRTPGHHQAVA